MAGRAAIGALAALPLLLALTDSHLATAPLALVVSTATGALAVSALAFQPLLAARGRAVEHVVGPRGVRWHRRLGVAALALVLAHVVGLFVVEVDDTLFALSRDGPTRARMALIATLALFAVVVLGLARNRLPLADASWRLLHAYLAVLVIVLGIGHAVLTDGALDGAGTPVLVLFGVFGLVAAGTAHLSRRPRRRSRLVSRRTP